VYGESRDRDSEEHSRSDNLDTRYVVWPRNAEGERGEREKQKKTCIISIL